MSSFEEYKRAKRNILDYIEDRDKFNKVYNEFNFNIKNLETIINTTYKNFDFIDKHLVLEFLNSLKDVLKEEKQRS